MLVRAFCVIIVAFLSSGFSHGDGWANANKPSVMTSTFDASEPAITNQIIATVAATKILQLCGLFRHVLHALVILRLIILAI